MCSAYESEKISGEQVMTRLVLINLRKGVIHRDVGVKLDFYEN
jgi:hypothetical protein